VTQLGDDSARGIYRRWVAVGGGEAGSGGKAHYFIHRGQLAEKLGLYGELHAGIMPREGCHSRRSM